MATIAPREQQRQSQETFGPPRAEFDLYAELYKELLHDPIRERFAPGSRFFCERKLLLLTDFCRRQQIPAHTARWLDVGCGLGELLDLGKSEFQHVAGCDPSAGMISQSRGFEVRQQTAPDQIPFENESFDLITAVCVYHHVGRRALPPLTAEVARVLRPGGIFCLIEHNPFNPVTQLIVRRTPVDANARLLTARSAGRLVRAAGMQVQETQYFLYFPERFYARLASLEAKLSSVPLGGQYALFCKKLRAAVAVPAARPENSPSTTADAGSRGDF